GLGKTVGDTTSALGKGDLGGTAAGVTGGAGSSLPITMSSSKDEQGEDGRTSRKKEKEVYSDFDWLGDTVGGAGKGVGDTVGLTSSSPFLKPQGLGNNVGSALPGRAGTTVSGATKGVGDTVSGVTGGLGDGVGKLGQGDVVGGLGSTVGGVGKGVGGLASGIWGGISGSNQQQQEE
ncbi:hypothetical protein KC318_g19164, partial [Hortaea werneckii]